MLVTKQSAITGITRTMDLPITQEQLDSWHKGVLAPIAFSNLSDSEREFLITGVTEDDWDDNYRSYESF